MIEEGDRLAHMSCHFDNMFSVYMASMRNTIEFDS